MTTIDSSRIPTRRRRRGTAVAAVAALAGAAVLAAAVPSAQADTQRPIGPRLQAILDRAVDAPAATFPGVALRVRAPGHGTWAGAAGKARLEPSRRMRAGDRFRAGSIMKPFVATATLQLAEEGRFALDDPLPAVLPARTIARFPEADRITVRMLLNHTSGIAEYNDEAFEGEVASDPQRRWKLAELLDRAAAMPRTGAPGERWAYANTNYNLLGRVLEHATGKPWRAVVRERVIERLHLGDTSLPRPGRRPAGRDIAHGYELVGGALRDLSGVDSSMAGAGGGHAMLTTTKDLSRFMRALFAGRLFRREATLKEMRELVAATGDGLTGYGLGLEHYDLPGGVEVEGHMGSSAGYRALMFHLPAQNIDITMIITSRGDPTTVLFPVLELLLGSEG